MTQQNAVLIVRVINQTNFSVILSNLHFNCMRIKYSVIIRNTNGVLLYTLIMSLKLHRSQNLLCRNSYAKNYLNIWKFEIFRSQYWLSNISLHCFILSMTQKEGDSHHRHIWIVRFYRLANKLKQIRKCNYSLFLGIVVSLILHREIFKV